MSTHLVVRDLAVSFNGFMAVSGLDLTINKGELRCLIGPNGAGKTTCLDLICGKVKPTAGSILFNGKHLEALEEYTIARAGVGRKFQVPSVFRELTVRQIWKSPTAKARAYGPISCGRPRTTTRPGWKTFAVSSVSSTAWRHPPRIYPTVKPSGWRSRC